MIKINLLPSEKRRPERTPLPRFLILIAGIAISLILLFLDIKTFTEIKNQRVKLNDERSTLNAAKQQTKEYNKIKKQYDKISKIEKSIKTLNEKYTKAEWIKIIDELMNVMNHPASEKVWITSLEGQKGGKKTTARRSKSKIVIDKILKFNANAYEDLKSSSQIKHMVKFRELIYDFFIKTGIFSKMNTELDFTTSALKIDEDLSIAVFKFPIILQKIVTQSKMKKK